MRCSCALLACLLAVAMADPAGAQRLTVDGPWGPLSERAGVALLLDDDDDDEDGLLDLEQGRDVPGDDLLQLRLQGPSVGAVEVRAAGGIRLVIDGRPVEGETLRLAGSELPRRFHVQGTRLSAANEPARLHVSAGAEQMVVPIHVFGFALLDAHNRPIDPRRRALGVSLRVTNDLSLPRSRAPDVTSPDPDNVRLELRDSRITRNRVEVLLRSVDPGTGRTRDEQSVLLTRLDPALPHRSRFMRLVADGVDAEAAGVADQVLRVAVRDRIRVQRLEESALVGLHDQRVGRPGDEHSDQAALHARVRVVVLRARAGGPPVIGHDELSARDLVRAQIATSNQIWAQCHITFGPPAEVSIEFSDPPGDALLAVGDGDGLPAAGDGSTSFRVNDTPIGPVPTRAGARPVDTALRLKSAIDAAGYFAKVTVNPKTSFGSDASADIQVFARDGGLARVEAIPGLALGTDSRQIVRIGGVDLGDGLDEFDNMTAQSGTLEERALLRSLMDDDPSSIDVLIVNRFARGSRQGEAFIESSDGPIANAVLIDRNGLSQLQSAWTLAHELGHVLLDEPLHPDNVGPDQPWLLMDSDSSRGTVLGPKRVTRRECQRVRRVSGPSAVPALLSPYDPRGDAGPGGKPVPTPALRGPQAR